MSELRVALVAEGRTDLVVIEAALRAILPRPFVLNMLQPEPTQPKMGQGWGGVFKWCRAFRGRGASSLQEDATLSFFDLVVIHLDADVAGKSYSDLGTEAAAQAAGEPPLPCERPCPPPADTVRELERLLSGWLGAESPDTGAVRCIPSKSTESWLVAAAFQDRPELLERLECRTDLEQRLAVLPANRKLRKSERQYRAVAGKVTQNWHQVTTQCTQAKAFDDAIRGRLAAFASGATERHGGEASA